MNNVPRFCKSSLFSLEKLVEMKDEVSSLLENRSFIPS